MEGEALSLSHMSDQKQTWGRMQTSVEKSRLPHGVYTTVRRRRLAYLEPSRLLTARSVSLGPALVPRPTRLATTRPAMTAYVLGDAGQAEHYRRAHSVLSLRHALAGAARVKTSECCGKRKFSQSCIIHAIILSLACSVAKSRCHEDG
jgi:hypothetical protein